MVSERLIKIIWELVKNGDVAVITIIGDLSFRKQQFVLTDRDGDGWSIMHWAIYQGNLAMVAGLIEKFVHPRINISFEETTGRGWFNGHETMLHIALRYAFKLINHNNNRDDIAILLLDSGADPSARDQNGLTAMHWACQENCYQVVRRLIDTKPALLSAQDRYGNTCLHLAVQAGHLAIVRMLVIESGRRLLEIRNHEQQRAFDLPAFNHIRAQIQRSLPRQRVREITQHHSGNIYQQNSVVCLFKDINEISLELNNNKRQIDSDSSELLDQKSKRIKQEIRTVSITRRR